MKKKKLVYVKPALLELADSRTTKTACVTGSGATGTSFTTSTACNTGSTTQICGVGSGANFILRCFHGPSPTAICIGGNAATQQDPGCYNGKSDTNRGGTTTTCLTGVGVGTSCGVGGGPATL